MSPLSPPVSVSLPRRRRGRCCPSCRVNVLAWLLPVPVDVRVLPVPGSASRDTWPARLKVTEAEDLINPWMACASTGDVARRCRRCRCRCRGCPSSRVQRRPRRTGGRLLLRDLPVVNVALRVCCLPAALMILAFGQVQRLGEATSPARLVTELEDNDPSGCRPTMATSPALSTK